MDELAPDIVFGPSGGFLGVVYSSVSILVRHPPQSGPMFRCVSIRSFFDDPSSMSVNVILTSAPRPSGSDALRTPTPSQKEQIPRACVVS